MCNHESNRSAQKFGAVVSHVRVGRTQKDIQTVRIPAGDADLLIGCDLAVAASADALAKVDQKRSSAVVNITEAATTEFVRNPDAVFPTTAMQETLIQEVGKENAYFTESSTIATRLMGDAIGSNLFLLGYAYQAGLIPVSAAAIDEAIELNGVAVVFNQQAFRWGRTAVASPEKLAAAMPRQTAISSEPNTLDELIADRSARLVDYQNDTYAEQYEAFMTSLREAIVARKVAASEKFVRAVANNLFRLMAYKDEYEVARLFSNGDFSHRLQKQFIGNYRLRFHLAPPLLARRDQVTGIPKKRELPGWIRYLFPVLASMRQLRGTRFDLFGYSAERKTERFLINEYRELISGLLETLAPDNIAIAAEIAEAATEIRGFGHVKLNNLEKIRQRWQRLLEDFHGHGDVVRVVERAA